MLTHLDSLALVFFPLPDFRQRHSAGILKLGYTSLEKAGSITSTGKQQQFARKTRRKDTVRILPKHAGPVTKKSVILLNYCVKVHRR